jgi:hypothetical protein
MFSLILVASVVTPTCFSIIEKTCEIEMTDVGEEEENKGKEGVKDTDVKIYYSHNASFLYQSLEKKKRISFYSKNYTSYYKKLVSPPPELLS